MADNKKRTRSPELKKLFRNRTDINKARRAKRRERLAAKAAIRAEKRAAIKHNKRVANALNLHRRPGLNFKPQPSIGVTIRLHENGKTFHEMTVESVVDGPRDASKLPKDLRAGAMGSLIHPGGVTFITRAGKKWHVKFNEFSFVFNHKE